MEGKIIMKVCFFTHFSNTFQDGATLSLINIVNELVKRGDDVVIIVPNKNKKFPIENDKVKCITVPTFSMRVPIYKNDILSKIKGLIKILLNRSAYRKALNVIKNENPDIIHINGLDSTIGAVVAKKLNIPYVWHIRQLMEEDLGLRLLNKQKVFNYLRKADSVIAISNTIKNKYEKILGRELDLVYNGIPLENYKIEGINRFSSDVIHLLLAGRIVEEKGQLDAVKAIAHLYDKGYRNIRLLLVGNAQDLNYTAKIKNYIKERKLNDYIIIKEYVSDLSEYRKFCDIGLTCSKNEAFGRVTIETMLSSMLAIGANTGGTAEIIEDKKTGLVYEEGNYISLANQIEYAIKNKNEMKRFILSGHNLVIEKYSIERVVDQIYSIYKKILSNK